MKDGYVNDESESSDTESESSDTESESSDSEYESEDWADQGKEPDSSYEV